ncbi:putative formin 2 [Cryptosporidium felis]|nr:putative formin 2 [Cryptosporidium felis]
MINFTDQELACYETWYSIIKFFDEGYFDSPKPTKEYNIPKIGLTTAQFLKTSGIPVEILHDIWQIVDTEDKGELNLFEFGIACRLISFYQHEQLIPSNTLIVKIPSKLAYFNLSSFCIKTHRKTDKEGSKYAINSYFSRDNYVYDCINTFIKLDEDNNGYLDGTQILNEYMNSSLPRKDLKNIWNFSDLDNDGRLTISEFIIFNTLEKACADKKINSNVGITKQSLLFLIDKIIGLRSEKKESNKYQNNEKYNSHNIEVLNKEIDNFESEINELNRMKNLLNRLEDKDEQLIIKLNEKKSMG